MMSSYSTRCVGHGNRLFDRELSWIAFNRRLIYEAADPTQPMLGRLLKLAQAAAALDEYFMVRMPLLKGIVSGKEAIALDANALKQLRAHLRALVARQQSHFVFSLQPGLAQQGIHLASYPALNEAQQQQCSERFEDEVLPVLTALTTPPDQSAPDFSNLSLNLATWLVRGEEAKLGWVKLPRILPRFLVLATSSAGAATLVVPLEQVITHHLPTLFPDYEVQGCYPFRVTRSTDLGVLDSETANLMEMIQDSLQQRQQFRQAVRLEVVQAMPAWLRSHLIQQLALQPADLYGLQGWLGLSSLTALWQQLSANATPSWQPTLPAPLVARKPVAAMLSSVAPPPKPTADLFAAIAQQDVLLHFPYHSFTATVEQFVAQAALDEQVLAIKMTLYRTAVDAPIVRSLMAAVKAGKQVVVLVELTAPLDEAINIHWAKQLEKAGAHVIYGMVGFRTHTNLVLVVRQEHRQLQRYAYLGTGDYLPDRPQPYEDLGLLTSRPDVGSDLSHLFNYLTGCSRQVTYETLMVAPEQLKLKLQTLIQREAEHAQQGKPARLIAKLNLLADPDIIESLYAAASAGVEVDLIVRSTCRLRPRVPGMSDRIRVVSILGQHIEHSRIIYCRNDDHPQAWIGTADWTTRGLSERIEVMVPILDPELVTDIQTLLATLLADNQSSWQLQPDGQYIKRQPKVEQPAYSAQQTFIRRSQQRPSIDP
ncbi:MAG: polyphosphate kinase 1 [Leptolyngbyaceae cyanobacterium]